MKLLKNKWTIIAVLLAGIGGLAAFKLESKAAPQYFTETVRKGDIQNVVQATGTINAVTTVQVGSQVSGTIQTLSADFNSHVKKDQVVAQIDASLFQGAVLQARANLADAQANLSAAKANLAKSQAAAMQAKVDFGRYTTLAQEGVVATQQLDAARATSQSADAAVAASQAQVTQAGAQSAPTLFTIAQDLTKMQVYVSTDESDVGAVHTGQSVSFKVDAFPTQTFNGKVSAVRLNATTVQNVVTYTTVVDFDNPDMKLFPGMTAYVTVPVATATDVVKVPNTALRYTPDLTAQQITDLLTKNGITAGNSGGGRKGGASQQAATAVVWKMNGDKSLQPVLIKLGITDHATTEITQVLKGSLNPQDQVVTGAATASKTASATTAAPGVAGRGAGGAGGAGGIRVGR